MRGNGRVEARGEGGGAAKRRHLRVRDECEVSCKCVNLLHPVSMAIRDY